MSSIKVYSLFEELSSCIMIPHAGKGGRRSCFGAFKRSAVESWVELINSVSSSTVLKAIVSDIEDVLSAWSRSSESSVLVEAVAVYRGKPGGEAILAPLEWSLNIHPVYLFPYFPGSSVKGVVRTAVSDLLHRRGLDSTLVNDCLHALFGSAADEELPGISGLLFFDGVPISSGRLVEGDVLTPHYSGVDTELNVRPTPILGVSIATGTRFVFPVVVIEDLLYNRLNSVNEVCVDRIEGMGGVAGLIAAGLVYALEELGVGGKTGRGYGRFRIERLGLARIHRMQR